MTCDDDASAELRSAFVLNAVQSTLFGDIFSTWASSEQHGGNMLFSGLLRLYCGKLSGPGSLGAQHSGLSTLWLWMCPQAAVTVGKTMMWSWPGRTDVPRPVYLGHPCWGYGACKSDMPSKRGGFRQGWFQVTYSALLLRSWAVCTESCIRIWTRALMSARTHTHTHPFQKEVPSPEISRPSISSGNGTDKNSNTRTKQKKIGFGLAFQNKWHFCMLQQCGQKPTCLWGLIKI